MKVKQILTIVFITVLTIAKAQSPDKISYQAIIRNSNNELVSNQSVGVQITILVGSTSGTSVYSETHTKTTSSSGLISLEIGTGISSDSFSSINWEQGPFYLKTETDPFGGTEYTISGTTELLSVPYSLYANKAGNFDETDPIFDSSIAKGITQADTSNWNNNLSSYTETDPLFEASVSKGITEADTTNWNSKLSSYTESDPIFDAAVAKGITAADTTNWNNKLTSYIETDPIFEASVSKGITEADTTNWNSKLETEEQSLESVLVFGNSANSQIKNVTDPTEDQDAATKSYVDLLEKRLFQLEFSLGNDSVGDIEGNYYKIVKIGNQYWFAENLRSTKFNDGTDIFLEESNSSWASLTNNAYSWHNNDQTTAINNNHGALYNQYAAKDGRLCPEGWHVPDQSDWDTLIDFIGGSSVAGGKLKATGTTLWESPNTGATDNFGFNALPSSNRIGSSGDFLPTGFAAIWWSTSSSVSGEFFYYAADYNSSNLNQLDEIPTFGFSCRCIRD